MNSLQGKIVGIEQSGNLALVTVDVNPKITVKAIVIETSETAAYLKLEGQITVLFKETEVVIGIGENPNISLQNKISGTIQHMEKGMLLSKVVLDTSAGKLTSIISTNAANHLELAEKKPVMAMIKLNEVMLSK